MKENLECIVFWFRRDLRLNDNHGLYQALKSGLPVLPVFIFDKFILDSLEKDDARVSFIYQTLSRINIQLNSLGSSLLVLYDKPIDVFEKICNRYKVKNVFTNHDYEPYAIERDKNIAAFLQSKNISFSTFKDQVIFEKNEVLKSDGKPYTIFTPYSRIWKAELISKPINFFPSEKLTENFIRIDTFTFPSLTDIGFIQSNITVPEISINDEIISKYHITRNTPSINGTTKLGVHLRFGTVSVRHLVSIAQKKNEQWLNELIWREFFMMILFHFPHVITRSFKMKYDSIIWRNDESEFEKWCKGATGYPIVDAGMRELNETGFMHNRVRMIVASFLTKHLLIDWRWGEAYFAEKLLDYELSSNNGNWQWAAGCGCDAAPYFRIFNPEEQTKRFDLQKLYINKWLRDLAKYNLTPIVEHSFARKRALETFKKYLNAE